MEVKVVKYNERYFVWWKTNSAGKAQLIDTDGKKYSGTPSPDKLTVVKTIECKEFNGSVYFKTKIGIFSATTGKKIHHHAIHKMFE